MNAPKRWLETEEASPEALELLRAGRPPRRMDQAVRGRSRRRVAGLSMLPVAAGVLASWSQLALGAMVGAASTVAVVSLLNAVASRPTPPSTDTSRSSTSGPAPTRANLPRPTPVIHQSDPTRDVAPTPAGSARRPVAGSKPAATEPLPSAPPAEGLQQEIQLLEQARRKLASEPVEAQRVLLEHERRFAGGQLRLEREFLLIDALVRLGRRSEAEARARALEGQAPKSLYGERLDQILGRSGSREQMHE